MTQRQRQIATNFVRLQMLVATMEQGEKKVSKIQSRIISPALVDIVKREPMMVLACEKKGYQIEKLIEMASDIGFLKDGKVSESLILDDDASETDQVDNLDGGPENDGTTK